MTNIVILDSHTANPGDLNWDGLNEFGSVTLYNRTPADQIVERARDADIILTNKVPLSKETLDQLPNLKFISVLATGFNIIDLDEANRRGIPVSNVPVYSTDSVAQYVMAAVLHSSNNLSTHSQDVHDGGWNRAKDFCYVLSPQSELAGKRMGIVGFGRIGKRTGELANAFGMKVSAWNRSGPKDSDYPVEFVEFDKLLATSDYLSVHIPQTADNAGMFNADAFQKMKKGSVFINTARGGLVDEAALRDALESGHLGGAAVDVISKEPMVDECVLKGTPNLLITPHIAWATKEARSRLIATTVENVEAFLAGNPVNVVNTPK